VNLQQQWLTAAYMLLAGGLLGCAYDMVRALAHQFRVIRWLRWLFDIIYWLLAAPFIFYLLVLANEGHLRIYVFAFILFGGLLYFQIFSSLSLKFMVLLLTLTKKTCKLVIAPFIWLFRMLFYLLKAGWNKVCVWKGTSKPEG
jgi:hypothetical protein